MEITVNTLLAAQDFFASQNACIKDVVSKREKQIKSTIKLYLKIILF